MSQSCKFLLSCIMLMVVGATLMPLELMGDGFVCIEEIQKTNGEEKETGEEKEKLNDSCEISDAVLSYSEVCLGHKLDSENAPWLSHLWENAWSEIFSPPPESKG